ncbi:MAG TPA: 16S rRNA (guanine(527)-N(7))-methyltransferase RsmG [Solimonas sp.]
MSTPHPMTIALERGLRSMKIELPDHTQLQLLRYLDEMARWNTAYNLTAIRKAGDMVIRHLLDSLALLPILQALPGYPELRLLDVGAGAGLPGIPLAIAAPQLAVTVLDSNGKKARFMRHAQRTLALANVEVAELRVEAFVPAAPYAVIVSRAFAALADFVDATQPLLADGGVWVAMKGKLDPAELAAVPVAVDIRETRRLQVPGLGEERHAVIAGLKGT